MKLSGELFSEQKQSMRLGVDVREASRWPRGREARPHPRGSPDRLLSPIYIDIPKKHRGTELIGRSATASLCRHKKPIGALFRQPTRGGSLTGGHLHHPDALR